MHRARQWRHRRLGIQHFVYAHLSLGQPSTAFEDFRRLRDRGLRGVRLIISDDENQQWAWQRFQVHVTCTVSGMVARLHRRALAADVKAVFDAPTLA